MDPSWAMEDLHMFLHQLYQHLSCNQRFFNDLYQVHGKHPAGAMTPMTFVSGGRRTGRDAAYEDLPRHRNQASALGNSWRAAKCLFRVLLVVVV